MRRSGRETQTPQAAEQYKTKEVQELLKSWGPQPTSERGMIDGFPQGVFKAVENEVKKIAGSSPTSLTESSELLLEFLDRCVDNVETLDVRNIPTAPAFLCHYNTMLEDARRRVLNANSPTVRPSAGINYTGREADRALTRFLRTEGVVRRQEAKDKEIAAYRPHRGFFLCLRDNNLQQRLN